MTSKEHLVEQHIREYQARLKHVDELMAQAEQTRASDDVALIALKEDHDALKDEVQNLGRQAIHWSEKGGPMVMWDVMAERLEHLVERIEHWRTTH